MNAWPAQIGSGRVSGRPWSDPARVVAVLLGAALCLLFILAASPARAAEPNVEVVSAELTRATNGYLRWNVTARLSGFRGPGGACGTSNPSCSASLDVAPAAPGPVEALELQDISSLGDPTTVTFSGVANVARAESWRISIAGSASTYRQPWNPFSDPNPAQDVTAVSGTGLTRARNGLLQFDVTAAAVGYGQPDRACARSSTCNLRLEARGVDGSVHPLQSAPLTIGDAYPTDVTIRGEANIGVVDAWRFVITSGTSAGSAYIDPWTGFVDPLAPVGAPLTVSKLYRDADDLLHWEAHARVTGVWQPGGPCNRSEWPNYRLFALDGVALV